MLHKKMLSMFLLLWAMCAQWPEGTMMYERWNIVASVLVVVCCGSFVTAFQSFVAPTLRPPCTAATGAAALPFSQHLARRALPVTFRAASPRTERNSHIRRLNQDTFSAKTSPSTIRYPDGTIASGSSTTSRRRGVGYPGFWVVSSRASTSVLHSVAGGEFDCDSEQECDAVYDDDVVIATETGHHGRVGKGVVNTGDASPAAVADERRLDGARGGKGFREQGLEHQQKVLDDGYEKQDMVKWRDVEVVENDPASMDDRSRLITLSVVEHDGLEHEFSKAAWIDNYRVPGQFIGIRLDGGTKENGDGTGKVAGSLVAVSTEPTTVRREGGTLQVLVSDEESFRLKGDTRGPAEEAEGRTLAALKPGELVKISDFMGRGFCSLFVGWIGLQSALQEQQNIVIIACGVRGMGSVRAVLDWPPIQAHAGIRRVSVFVEDESPVSAPFLRNVLEWRAAGIRVTHSFTSLATMPGVTTSLEDAIFGGDGLMAAVGGKPEEAFFLMAGLGGKRATELTDRLTDEGVDASRLLFNDFF